MKIRNILLSATIFALVGCGGTGIDTNPELGGDKQGAIGNYNNTFGNKNIAGIWNVYGVQNNYVNRNQPSARFELDGYGKLYNVPVNGAQKQQVATYSLISDQELKIATQSGEVVAQYASADQQDNNCFYTRSTFNNQAINELWCKRPETGFQPVAGSQPDMRPDIGASYGTPVELKGFLYPDKVLNGGSITETVHYYDITSQNQIKYEGAVINRFTRKDTPNAAVITQTQNGYEHKTDEIYYDKIVSFTKNNYGSYDTEEYPDKVAVNDKVSTVTSDGITMICIAEDIKRSQDISGLLDPTIQQDFISKVTGGSGDNYPYFAYNDTDMMHIHCGTTNGAVMDSYHVNGWGEVLKIVKYGDGSSRYEILDKKSIQFE